MLDRSVPEEEAVIQQMHEFNNSFTGYIGWTYALRNPETNEVSLTKMANRPCYGEMRAYGKDSTRPQDYKPGDLTRPMKAFKTFPHFREAISVAFYSNTRAKETERQLKFLFSPESPFRAGIDCNNLEFSEKDGRVNGVVMWGTDVDPTTMVSLFMMLRDSRHLKNAKLIQDHYGASDLEAFTLGVFSNPTYDSKTRKYEKYPENLLFSGGDGYSMSLNPNLAFYKTGEINNLSNGGTWRNGEDYNRPQLHHVHSAAQIYDAYGEMPIEHRYLVERLAEKSGAGKYEYKKNNYPREEHVRNAIAWLREEFTKAETTAATVTEPSEINQEEVK